ncbi:MAG: HEAT repeat domain-containing protein [Deltaproteobacteria bacterium]|nr:HEAT repeat domain-containing protein [Deltaproteobacteria bacterium]MCL5792861.1 HEAT repeat domain-containing protein [Deltaproteobacteria bacterium]
MTDDKLTTTDLNEEEKIRLTKSLDKFSYDENVHVIKSLLGDESFRVRKAAIDEILQIYSKDKLIDIFIDMLSDHNNAGLRTAGIEGLTRIGRHGIKKILRAINPEDWELSKLLVDVIGELNDPKAIGTLLALTHVKQQNLATAAIEALGKIGTQDIVNDLCELLREKELYVVFSTVESIANLGQRGFKIPIQNVVPLLNDPLFKKAVYDLLGSSHEAHAVQYLIEGIRDTKRINMEAAAQSMLKLYLSLDEQGKSYVRNEVKNGHLYDQFLIEKLLSSINPHARAAGIRIAGWSGIASSLNLIFRYAEEPEMQDACLSALLDLNDQVKEDVIGLLIGSNNIYHIRLGLKYLSHLPEEQNPYPEGLSYIIKYTDEPDILMLLSDVIGNYIHENSLKLFMKIITSSVNEIQDHIINNFVKVGQRLKVFPFNLLKDMVHSTDYRLRLSAAKLIKSFYNKDSDDYVKTLLNDSEPAVRAAIILTIGEIKLHTYVEDIKMALTDENRDVRIEAIRTVSLIEPEHFIETIKWISNDEDPWIRAEIVKNLICFNNSEEAYPLLKPYLYDESPIVMLTALQNIVNLQCKDAGADIENTLAGRDVDVISEAIQIVGKSKTGSAQEILKKLLSSSDDKIKQVIVTQKDNIRWIG